MDSARRNDFEIDHPYFDALMLLAEKRPNEALAMMEVVVSPVDPAAYDAALAEVYRALGRHEESAQRAQSAIAGGWDTHRLRTILGHALWKMGLKVEAESLYERAAPENESAGIALGWIDYHAGRFQRAEERAAQALRLQPDSLDARLLHLAARAACGDPVARRQLREAWTEDGTPEAIEWIIADANRRKAFAEIEDLLPGFRAEAAHSDRLARIVLRAVYDRHGQEEALRLFYELPLSIRDDARVQTLAALFFWRAGRKREAVEQYERAFEAEPTNREAAEGLGRAYLRLGKLARMLRITTRHVKAVSAYENALGLESKSRSPRT